MTTIAVSRRNLLATGAWALMGATGLQGPARANAPGGQNLINEEITRNWYAAWEKKDVGTFNILLADNFTFTSAAGDDHISKRTFKTQCWDTQVDFISGKTFRNVEYLRIKDGKLESTQSSFPSAVSAQISDGK